MSWLEKYYAPDRREWKKLINEAFDDWSENPGRPISDVAWDWANDETTDWIYTANEDALLAACAASTERVRAEREEGYGVYDIIEDERVAHRLFEIVREATHTFLFIDLCKKAEKEGFNIDSQKITDDGKQQYTKAIIP